jgi:hypothetical protein
VSLLVKQVDGSEGQPTAHRLQLAVANWHCNYELQRRPREMAQPACPEIGGGSGSTGTSTDASKGNVDATQVAVKGNHQISPRASLA